MKGERVIHQHVSESHKPNMSGNIMSAAPNATKSELSDVSVTHTNTIHHTSFSLLSILQGTRDGALHQQSLSQVLPPKNYVKETVKPYFFGQDLDPGEPTSPMLMKLRDGPPKLHVVPHKTYHAQDNGEESRTTLFQPGGS